MVVKYYENLFKSELREGRVLITGAFPYIDVGLMEALEAEVTEEETKRALNRIDSYKVPGPDGY